MPVPEDVGVDTPLPGLTLEVVDMDVSKNAEFSIFLEPITPNSEVKSGIGEDSMVYQVYVNSFIMDLFN